MTIKWKMRHSITQKDTKRQNFVKLWTGIIFFSFELLIRKFHEWALKIIAYSAIILWFKLFIYSFCENLKNL